MIGDDIVSDIGGAQQCGIRGIHVGTGKFKYYPQRLQNEMENSRTLPFY